MKGKWIKTDIRMLRCMIEYIYFAYVELNFWTEYACLLHEENMFLLFLISF